MIQSIILKEKKKILNKILSTQIIPANYNIILTNKKKLFKFNPILNKLPFHKLTLFKNKITNKTEIKLYTTSLTFIDKKKYIHEYLIELPLLDLQYIKNSIFTEICFINESVKRNQK